MDNRYGDESPYRSDSSNNPFGAGIKICGDEQALIKTGQLNAIFPAKFFSSMV